MIPIKVEQLVVAVGGELLTGNINQLIKNITIDSFFHTNYQQI